jgi:hypothetical protein
MPRRISIEIKVEEQSGSNSYSWSTLASAEFVSSVELFAPEQTVAGMVAGVSQLLTIAQIKSDADRALDQAYAAADDQVPA